MVAGGASGIGDPEGRDLGVSDKLSEDNDGGPPVARQYALLLTPLACYSRRFEGGAGQVDSSGTRAPAIGGSAKQRGEEDE